MLTLSNLIPFASGSHRNCFIHPHDPMLCVKVLRSDTDSQANRRRRHWVKSWFRSRAYYDENLREFAEYRRLIRIGDEAIWRYVPRHHGFIDTDLGRAAVVRLVRNSDGSIARSLEEEISRGNVPHDALREFHSFLDLGYLCNFRVGSGENVVCARLEDESFRLLIVDGLQSNGFQSSFRGKKHARRYAERFKSDISNLIRSSSELHKR